ncbi:helix-turn-helix domain-containing protein [Salinisphaera sp.]|uniref:helix-turn-helix domain-containing protein n=1 Tax=Salinisphaera sp. TaxID=1914330 RepID=UPI002D770876|nr:RodZ domain-containing protein [Salinisphaera sp.]HET7314676.1 RodZ domain-containing protein [Salinisphaera sp.]
MNAKHDYQSEPKDLGLNHDADEETASAGLVHNKADGMTPGEILREGRLSHDYSIDDLCAQTKLNARTVEALEDNDFGALSQPVFARGYYRQCAKVLDLDVDRLMAAYTAIAGETPRPRIDHGAAGAGVIPREVTPSRGFRFRRLFLLLIIIVVVIGAIVFVLPSNSEPDTIGIGGNAGSDNGGYDASATQTYEFNSFSNSNSGADDNTAAGAEPGAASDTGASEAADTPDVTAASADGGQAPTGRQAGGRNVKRTLGLASPTSDQANAEPGQDGNDAAGPSAPAVPPNRLVLTFSKRSWVRVTDANGNRMASRIFEAGEEKKFNGEPPYKITLGFAPGVKMTIGGQPVDIAGQTNGGSVAHLTVDAAGGDNDDG